MSDMREPSADSIPLASDADCSLTESRSFTELCDEFANVLGPYLDWLMRTHRNLDLRGLGEACRGTDLELNAVYVPLAMDRVAELGWASDSGAVQKEYGEGDIPQDWMETLTYQEEEARERAELVRWREIEASPTGGATLEEMVRERSRIVMVGNPGSGKTTLLRFLTWHFAQACQQRAERVMDSDNRDYGPTRLPIFVGIAEYAMAFRTRKIRNLRAYLTDAFGDVLVLGESLGRCFEAFLQAGYGLIVLDGLDEVTDAGERDLIAAEIAAFSDGAGHNRVVVTSRMTGYRASPLNAEFALFSLRDMNEGQRKTFLTRYLTVCEETVRPQAAPAQVTDAVRKTCEALEAAIEQSIGVRRLAGNPLLLTVLMLAQQNGVRLPQQRGELYRVASEILLWEWPQAHGMEAEQCIGEAEALAIFGPLALWLHREWPTGMAPLPDVEAKLATMMAAARRGKAGDEEIRHAVTQFLTRARERTGLFVERAAGQYGFLYSAFRDYFAARQLAAQEKGLAQFIYQRRHLPRWRELILLAIRDVSSNRPLPASKLIRAGILGQRVAGVRGAFGPSHDENVLHRDLLLAAQCVGDCLSVEAGLSQEIGERIATLYHELYTGKRFRASHQMWVKRIAYLSGTPAGETAIFALVPVLRNPDREIWQSAITALIQQPALPSTSVSALVTMLGDGNGEFRVSIARVLGCQPSLPDEAVAEMMLLLRDKEGWVWFFGAEALGRQTSLSEKWISMLTAMLREENRKIRYCAAEVLREQITLPDTALSGLVALLHDEILDVQYRAVWALQKYPALPDAAIPALLTILRYSDGYIRMMAAEALWCQASLPPETVTALAALLHDEIRDVRYGAAKVLLRIGQHVDAAVLTVIALLCDGSMDGWSGLAEALGRQPSLSEEALLVLIAMLRGSNEQIREKFETLLEQQPSLPASAVSALVAMLSEQDRYAQCSAAKILLCVGQYTSTALSILLTLMHDPEAGIRRDAIWALEQQPSLSDEAMVALVAKLQDSDGKVRPAVIATLTKQPVLVSEAVSALVTLLHNSDPDTRCSAANGLLQLRQHTEAAMSALSELLHEHDASVRDAAVRALGWQSLLPEKTVLALVALLRDSEQFVRDRVTAVLGQQISLPASAFSTLMVFMRDTDVNVRFNAVKVLGHQSARPRSTLDLAQWPECARILRAMIDDPDTDGYVQYGWHSYVHDVVWEALWNVRSRLAMEEEETGRQVNDKGLGRWFQVWLARLGFPTSGG